MTKWVALDAKLDSAAVDKLRGELLGAQNGDIALDGSSVEQIGGLCLELVMSVRHLWGAAGHAVTLENPSDQMLDDLGRFGLTGDDFKGRPA